MTKVDKHRASIIRAAIRGIRTHGTYNIEVTCEGETLADYEASEKEMIEAALSVDHCYLETVNLYTGQRSFAYFIWVNDLCDSLSDYGVSLETALTKCRAKCDSYNY